MVSMSDWDSLFKRLMFSAPLAKTFVKILFCFYIYITVYLLTYDKYIYAIKASIAIKIKHENSFNHILPAYVCPICTKTCLCSAGCAYRHIWIISVCRSCVGLSTINGAYMIRTQLFDFRLSLLQSKCINVKVKYQIL